MLISRIFVILGLEPQTPKNEVRKARSANTTTSGLILLTLCLFIAGKFNFIIHEWIASNDAANAHFWMHRFNGNYFSPGDTIAQFAEVIHPDLFKLIYRVFLTFLSLKQSIILFELLNFCLLSFVCYQLISLYPFKFKIYFYLFLLVLVALPDSVGGFSRAMSTLIIVVPFYFLTKKKGEYGAGFGIMLSAFIYPVSYLLSMFSCMFFLGFETILNRRIAYLKKGFVILCFSIPVIILLPNKSSEISKNPLIGKAITISDIVNEPCMGQNGRVKLKQQFTTPIVKLMVYSTTKSTAKFFANLGVELPKRIAFIIFVLIIILWGYSVFCKYSFHDSLLVSILLSGIFLFLLARFFPFNFFQPLRYLQKTFPIILTLALFIILNKLVVNKIKEYLIKVMLSIACILGLYFNNFLYDDYSEYKNLYKAIETICPSQSMLAAPPVSANMIPYFSKRSVIVSYESCHGVYFTNYRESQMERINDIITLYSSKELHEIKKIIKKYSLNYIILDKQEFISTEKPFRLFDPFNGRINKLMDSKSFQNSLLNTLPNSFSKNIDSRFSILNCNVILNNLN